MKGAFVYALVWHYWDNRGKWIYKAIIEGRKGDYGKQRTLHRDVAILFKLIVSSRL